MKYLNEQECKIIYTIFKEPEYEFSVSSLDASCARKMIERRLLKIKDFRHSNSVSDMHYKYEVTRRGRLLYKMENDLKDKDKNKESANQDSWISRTSVCGPKQRLYRRNI